MASYKTKGIIIKRSNFGEADRLLTIYTEKYGKVRAIAKGARKPTSRLGGNLEPFCSAYFVIAEGRNLDIVTEAEIIECFFKIRNNLKSVNSSFYIGEVIDKLIEERQSHPEVFELLIQVLEKINTLPDDLVLPYFEINFLSAVGYRPELYKCINCSKKIESGGNTFDFEGGGIVCKNCAAYGMKLSDEAVKVMRIFLHDDIKVIEKLRLNKQNVEEIIDLLDNYIKHNYQQEFKSRRFIK